MNCSSVNFDAELAAALNEQQLVDRLHQDDRRDLGERLASAASV